MEKTTRIKSVRQKLYSEKNSPLMMPLFCFSFSTRFYCPSNYTSYLQTGQNWSTKKLRRIFFSTSKLQQRSFSSEIAYNARTVREWRQRKRKTRTLRYFARRVEFFYFYIGQLKIILLHHIPHIGNSSCIEEAEKFSVDNYDFFWCCLYSFFEWKKRGRMENIPTRFAVNQVERLNIFFLLFLSHFLSLRCSLA